MDDLAHSVRLAVSSQGIVNIPLLAQQIHGRNSGENVALDDIARQLLVQAQIHSAAVEFDGR